MNRAEMVTARAGKLSKLDDKELVQAILTYFKQNRTLGGEKALKEKAKALMEELELNDVGYLDDSTREELIRAFSSVCVKEVRLKNVEAKNETEQNMETAELKAGDLPMVLRGTEHISVNTMKDTYELPVLVTGFSGGRPTITFCEADPFQRFLAYVPEGFRKNHWMLYRMDATVIATDYSNGKLRNMSYRMVVDLAQDIAA